MGGLAPWSRMSTARLIATVVMSVSAAVVLAALMPADALAAGCTDSWARAESGPWSTPANWSTGSVPTSSDEVCITTSGEYTVTLTGSVSVKSLTLGTSSGSTKQTLLVGGLTSGTFSLAASSTIDQAGVLDLESAGASATVQGSATIVNHGEVLSSATSTNFLEVNLTNVGTLDVKGGELRQDDNTTTTNEGAFEVGAGAEFAATAGDDLIVNKSSVADGGAIALSSGASWTQEAGSAEQSGSPVELFGGVLTDVSGGGTFDLIDSTTLSGTIPAGQTVVADAIPGHNASIAISGTVTNNGTLALVSPVGGGEAIVHGTQLNNLGVLSADSETSNASYLEVGLTTGAGGVLDVEGGELRQDDNTTTTNEGAFSIAAGAEFEATAGDDLIVNKSSLANSGKLELSSGASWIQESGSTEQSGNAVTLFGGALTDVSGARSFDLIDSTTLSGTIPAGQTVTADAIPGHNATIEIPATVVNEGTVVLLSASGGGYADLLGTTGSSSFVNDGLLSAQSAGQLNYLEVPLTNTPGATVEVQSGELRQDDNTTTTNEGTFKVEGAGIFQATAGDDVFVNKGVFSNAGGVTLTNGASWSQEAGSAAQSGNPVSMFSGTLTDVSGKGSFDLIDSPTLVGTVPAGQMVTADAIAGHNAYIDLSGTVTNDGTIALLANAGGGDADIHGSQLDNVGTFTSFTEASLNYLEAPLTNVSGATVEVQSGELRQDDNTTTTNEGTFKVLTGATLAATAGDDVFVNKGVFSNAGGVTLTNGASWSQEAGSAAQSGNPVSMFSGTLTDVSGKGSFDLIDSPTLVGTVPAGQTVTADAIAGHNAYIDLSGTVTNDGTIALLANAGGGDADIHGSQLDNVGTFTSFTEASLNYLEAPLLNGSGGVVNVIAGELRQDDNTITTNEGTFSIAAGAEFQATTGDDLIVNKSSLANSGKLELDSGASWTQEAGSSEQSGSPVAIFGGVLTDVSGGGTFDLIDSSSLSGAIPAGQTVVADAITGHNSSIDLTGASGEVVNEGTFVLDDPSSGTATVHGVEFVNRGSTEAQTAAPTDTTYLEANLTNAADGTVEVKSGELRQDDNTTTTNEGTLQIAASATLAATTGGDVLVNNGKLEPDLASATSFGIVNVSGGATFHPGGTLLPNLVGGYAPPVGAEFNVITDAAPISGEFANVANNFLGDYSEASLSPSIIAVKRDRDSTSTALIARPETTTQGQSVTFTATITTGQGSVGNPTGIVTFFDGVTTLGTGEVSTTAGVTTAGFTTSALAAGRHEIVAAYDGDPNSATSRSAPAEVTVAPIPPVSGSTGGGGGGEPKAQIATNTPTVPPPLLAKTGNVAPVAGTVLVQLPGTSKSVPLSTLQQVPFGSVIEATSGTVSVTTARSGGGTQTGEFFSGEFILRQGPNGLVIAELTGGDFSVCPTKRERSHIARAGSVQARAAAASGSHVVRKLWANAHGKFSTKGNYAAGSVQGTEWLTEDLCDGTVIKVTRDKVAVTNLVNHKHVEVTTGHKYLAKAP